jgi:hypothetical protein
MLPFWFSASSAGLQFICAFIDPKMRALTVRLTALICAGLLLTMPVQIYAQDAKLANIIVTNTRDNLLLYLTAKDAFPSEIENAIHSGVPTTFSFYIKLHRVRGLWIDEKITDITLTHTLKYNSLKKEYIVTRSWEGERLLTVESLEAAKNLMTEVDSLVIVPLKQLEKGQQYQISAKAELSKMTLPFYLHYILFFVSFWDVETDWYTINFIY